MEQADEPTRTAAEADPYELYERAVQEPEGVIEMVETLCEQMGGREPVTLREDFCGTAQVAAMWVRSAAERCAVAVDNDPEVIRRAEAATAWMGEDAARLRLTCSDVTRCRAAADAIVSMNFSHFVFKTRQRMLRYFKHARRCLRPGGIFVMDLYGGPGAQRPETERRRCAGFEYVWQQESFDPLTHRVVNHIHFRFDDGTSLERAFTYDWRLWSLVELRELLEEAGFKQRAVCFADENGLTDELDTSQLESWVAYLIARNK